MNKQSSTISYPRWFSKIFALTPNGRSRARLAARPSFGLEGDTKRFTLITKTLKQAGIRLLVAGCFVAVVCAQTTPGSKPQQVDVVNTPTVNVGNTPAVQVTGTVGVSVKNDKSAPLPVKSNDEPARKAFLGAGVDSISRGTNNTAPLAVQAVPQGKVLVIEYIDFHNQEVITAGKITRWELIHTTAGQQTSHTFPVYSSPSDAGNPGTFFFGREQVRFYADPGTQVFFLIFSDGLAGTGSNGAFPASLVATVSGYLVDAQ